MNDCYCCGKHDDRTTLGSPWCMDCFVLPLWRRQMLAQMREHYGFVESDDVEGYRKAA